MHNFIEQSPAEATHNDQLHISAYTPLTSSDNLDFKRSTRSRGSSRKFKPNDANNNNNNSTMKMSPTSATKPSLATSCARNKNSEKYSLRQRHRKCTLSTGAQSTENESLKHSLHGDADASKPPSNSTKYDFNFTTKRSSTLRIVSTPKEKVKTKAAPLSKYRRKTANARERTRMREINAAFETLRKCVPSSITGDEATSTNEKLTKITTLRMAMKYISILSETLRNPALHEDLLFATEKPVASKSKTRNSTPSDPEKKQSPATMSSKSRPKVKRSKLQATKATTPRRQRTKKKILNDTSPYLTMSSLNSSSCSVYASASTSPLFDDCNSMTDFSNKILESDGESLHLSEPCLSPLNRNLHLGIQQLTDSDLLIQNTCIALPNENPLELSLRLLESDGDPLQFSLDQQPSSCISPFAALESLNPFGDLLHSEFPEHSSLDLFLT